MQGARGQQETSVGTDGQEPKPNPGKKGGISSLATRLLSALIAIPIVLALLWLGGWFSFATVLVLVLWGTYELHGMLRHAGYRPLLLVSTGVSTLFLLAAMVPDQEWRWRIFQLALTVGVFGSFFFFFGRKDYGGVVIDWAFTLINSFYLGWTFSFIPMLRGYEVGSFNWSQPVSILPRGGWWVLVILLGVWGFDSAAFFAGRYLGRHKLAPRISPAKTWEGVAGGFVCSIAAALIVTVGPLGVPWYYAILLGVLIGISAVFGDLVESLIKRQMHVKDSGQFLPGHGGMLDRIDSLLFTIVVVYFFAQAIGV